MYRRYFFLPTGGATGLRIFGGVAIAEFGLTYAVGEILDHCASEVRGAGKE
jgi:hypothetical protein